MKKKLTSSQNLLEIIKISKKIQKSKLDEIFKNELDKIVFNYYKDNLKVLE